MISPCNKVCVMDAASGLCRGCYRTLDEIARWAGMADAERTLVLAGLAARQITQLKSSDGKPSLP